LDETLNASPSNELDEALISKIVIHKYRKGKGSMQGIDCFVCLGVFGRMRQSDAMSEEEEEAPASTSHRFASSSSSSSSAALHLCQRRRRKRRRVRHLRRHCTAPVHLPPLPPSAST
ncbi:hypothetical protein BHE74_00006753, partial [Ensete ventricosum]